MRLAFFGYSDIGYVSLATLLELCQQFQDEIVAVVTHPDNPQEKIWFRSVRDLAEQHHLPVYTPADPNTPEFVALIRSLQPDFLFSCYYRQLFKAPLLQIPRLGALNLHGSLLPRYRGRCPINWVLIHGEPLTGLTLHYMEEKPDAGDIVAQVQVPIAVEDTAWTLSQKLTEAAARLWRQIYPLLRAEAAPRIPQNHRQATYFGGRRPEDGLIDWRQTAWQVYNLIRAVTHPFPGAFTFWQGRKLFIWAAALVENWQGPALAPGQVMVTGAGEVLVGCGQGVLALKTVQWEGEEELSGARLLTWAQTVAAQPLGPN